MASPASTTSPTTTAQTLIGLLAIAVAAGRQRPDGDRADSRSGAARPGLHPSA